MLNILSGYDTANIKSLPSKADAVLADGEWAVFDSVTHKLKKQASTYAAATDGKAFIVFGGNDVRFDSKQMGAISVVTAKAFVGETDKFAAITINAGDPLTVSNGVLTNALEFGTAAVAGKRTYKVATNAVVDDTVTIDTIAFTAVASGATGNQFNVGETVAATATNLKDALAANVTLAGKYTFSVSTDTITIEETTAGGGDTPSVATFTGTVVITNALVATSAAEVVAANTQLDVVAYALTDNTSGVLQFVGA